MSFHLNPTFNGEVKQQAIAFSKQTTYVMFADGKER
jgi:hypothetical protein